jgi:hypothetical protein
MPLVLQKATPADLLASVPAQYAAFHTVDPLHMLIYPSPIHPTPEVIQKTIARQETTWSDPHVEWVKIVDDQTGDFGMFYIPIPMIYTSLLFYLLKL